MQCHEQQCHEQHVVPPKCNVMSSNCTQLKNSLKKGGVTAISFASLHPLTGSMETHDRNNFHVPFSSEFFNCMKLVLAMLRLGGTVYYTCGGDQKRHAVVLYITDISRQTVVYK